MISFEVVEKGPRYEARELSEGPRGIETAVALTAKAPLGSPELVVRQGAEGPVVASMHHNVTRTKFDCRGPSGEPLAELTFAWFTLRKGFTLKVGANDYKVVELEPGRFSCADSSGNVAMVIEVDKRSSLVDWLTFPLSMLSPRANRSKVSFIERIPPALAFASVLALNKRGE
jgi:hypothetical protein